MTECKSSASSFANSSIFVIHLVNGAEFLNDTCAAGAVVTIILSFTKI